MAWIFTVASVGLIGLTTQATEPPTSTNLVAPPKPEFQPNLPVIFLDVQKSIGSAPTVPATVRIQLPANTTGGATNVLPAQVRFHGATSQGYPKKSFALTLDAPARLLDLRQDAHWILQAAYVDRSLMRHKLAYDLFRSLSTTKAGRFAAGSRFVEVYLNGRYHGAYLLMERVDRKLLGLQPYRTNEVAHACLYKAVDHAANFSGNGRGGYEQREPEPSAYPYWEPVEKFDRFVSSSSDADFRAPQTGIAARLDLSNAIDFHLLVLLTSNSDGITKNYFFGRDAQASGPVTQKFVFAPWDYDGTFGRNWDGSRYPATDWLSNHLFDRLMQDGAYRQQFAARWKELRAGAFSVPTVQRMMDENVRTLGEAARRNVQRWPTDRGGYHDRITFEEDLAQMKAWVEKRVRWLDAEIERLGHAAK